MSKPKVWTLPQLLDRIWMLSRGKRTAVRSGETRRVVNAPPGTLIPCDKNGDPTGPYVGNTLEFVHHRVVTAYDEDYKERTYHLNKIGAPVAAALYERIKTMRAKGSETPSAAEKATGYREPLASQIQAWNDGYVKGLATYQTVNQPQPSIWKVAQEICPAPVSPAGAYERQFQDWADEVQRRGGL